MYSQLKTYFDGGKQITLPGIEESITMPHDTWFRYDGEVASLAENIYKTQRTIAKLKINGPGNGIIDQAVDSFFERITRSMAMAKIRGKVNDSDTTAVCTRHPVDERKTAYVIAIKRGLSESNKIFAASHESGEFLKAINQRALLQSWIDKKGIPVDCLALDGEDFADICGLYGLYKASIRGDIKIILPRIETRQSVISSLGPLFHIQLPGIP